MLIATALVAALALSVGALAYPVVVGTHPLSAVHTGTPATVNHPQTGDNSTGNETNDNETGDHQGASAANETENETAENETSDHQVAPFGNETDNDTEAQDNETAPVPPAPEGNETEMSNVSVEHNVTVTQKDNTTWVNGTIKVVKDNVTVVDITFQIVVHDNGTANVTFNGTNTVGSSLITVHGFAIYSAERHVLAVFGVATSTQNGTVQWQRMFAFEAPSECSYGP
jgi:hypothetical protein